MLFPPSRRRYVPGWKRPVRRLSTRMTRSLPPVSPSGQRGRVNYRIRFHPLVARELDAIARWVLDYARPAAAARKLGEVEAAIATPKATPHKGSLRDDIAPSGLIPTIGTPDFWQQ